MILQGPFRRPSCQVPSVYQKKHAHTIKRLRTLQNLILNSHQWLVQEL